jgi:hypothetical protein
MEGLPILAKVRAYVTPEFLEVGFPESLSAAPGGEEVIRHHAKCQKLLCEIAFRDRSYGSVVFPDTLYSTGAVASLLRYAQAGHRLVLCAALRQSEETVLAELAASGESPIGSRFSLTAEPLSISQRKMADLAVRHLHPEVAIYDWEQVGAPLLAAHRFWHVSGRRGLMLRTFYGLPVLMDYRAIETHNTDCLDRDIFENVYVQRNFSKCGGLHVVRDSDEFMLISLTPEAVGQRYVPRRLPHSRWLQNLYRECGLRASMHYFVGRTRDSLKGALFNSPMYWHVDDLDGAWDQKEHEISGLMRQLNGDYGSGRQAELIRFPQWYLWYPRRMLGDLYFKHLTSRSFDGIIGVIRRLATALGNAGAAWSRLCFAIRQSIQRMRP